MRIAHLTTVDMSLRFLLLPQLTAIRALGGEAVGVSAPGPWVEDLERNGVRHVPLPSSTRRTDLWADLRTVWEFWRVLRQERPDVLHTHNPKPGVYGRLLGRLAGIPLVVNTVHGIYATDRDPVAKRALVYLLEALAARCSDVELVQNMEDFALLTRLRVSSPSRTRLLGNGVDLQRFDPGRFDSSHRARVRHQLGIGESEVVVGAVGRLVAEKGFPELFEAAKGLEDRYVVLCMGPHDPDKPGALTESALGKARKAGVRILGMRPDLDELYPAMDIFVLASHREGFPRAAMEAAAMGLPVIATDIRGCREVVRDGFNGLLVPVEDPPALETAIRRLGEDPDFRADLGRAGAALAKREFDEERVVTRVLDAYREGARRKGLWELASSLEHPPSEPVTIRPARPSDLPTVAALHTEGIDTGFLTRLGPRLLRVLYRSLTSYRDGILLVADDGCGPRGFVAGVTSTPRFYRYFVTRWGVRALIAAFPWLFRPEVLRRAWETLRYPGQGGVDAELLSMAVAPGGRGCGLGTRLGEALLEEFRRRGIEQAKVVVGADNRIAGNLYRKLGFVPSWFIEVHAGEPSEALVWSQ